MKVCLIGGGNLSHALISAANFEYVSLVTSKPNKFKNQITGFSENNLFIGKIDLVTSNYEEAIYGVDLIIITSPGFLYETVLRRISEYINDNVWIGSIHATGGFDWIFSKVMPHHDRLFGFQRSPYIARIDTYGKSVSFSKKESVKVFTSLGNEYSTDFILNLSKALDINIIQLENFLEITLSNSNPILHPIRLYSIFNNIHRYHQDSFFYKDWDDDSSNLLVECDKELQLIVRKLPIGLSNFSSVLDHFESINIYQLTKKIISIQSWSEIKIDYDNNSASLSPNPSSRYFLEDVPFGIIPIKGVAQILDIETPHIDKVLLWCQKIMKKNFINKGVLDGDDIEEACIPQNFNIKTAQDLVIGMST